MYSSKKKCNSHTFLTCLFYSTYFSRIGIRDCWPDHFMALTVNLIGPSPWGFRIYGGRDFKKAITVSKVFVSGCTLSKPCYSLSNHILCFCQNNLKWHVMQSQLPPPCDYFLSLFVSEGCFTPISLTTQPVRKEWK